MSKLLSSIMNRLVRWSMMWFVAFVFAFIGIIDVLERSRYHQGFENLTFDFVFFLPIAVIGASGVFIGKDYSNHTIRNQIIVGHKRSSIYMANWIVTACIATLFFLALTLVSTVLGWSMLSTKSVSVNALLVNWLICFLIMLLHSSFTTFICMLGRSSSSLLLAIVLYFLSMMSVTFAEIFDMMNDSKLTDFVFKFVPTNAIYSLSTYEIAENAVFLLIYITAIIIGVTLLGAHLFGKVDIK